MLKAGIITSRKYEVIFFEYRRMHCISDMKFKLIDQNMHIFNKIIFFSPKDHAMRYDSLSTAGGRTENKIVFMTGII